MEGAEVSSLAYSICNVGMADLTAGTNDQPWQQCLREVT